MHTSAMLTSCIIIAVNDLVNTCQFLFYFRTVRDITPSKITSSLVSDKLSDVIDTYEHALLARFPRARYVVGKDAKYFFLPMQWMPEWLGDWIMHLQSPLPRPSSVR